VKPTDVITAARDGRQVPPGDLRAFVSGISDGTVPDYQASAWLMAVRLRGMSAGETAELTIAMRDSGQTLRWPPDPRPLVDKHSTGGVGDKASIVLAPLAAALGLRVPMISGRSLGHTGGTLDKLESIPGLTTDLDMERFQAQVSGIGVAMCGQTAVLAPADRKLYALRDATATVESVPLITASILSKKLAEGTDALLFDVKAGRGAFMQTRENAAELAESLVRTAVGAGVKAAAVVTGMDFLTGMTAGNSLEVRESIEVLSGRGPADTRALVVDLCCRMLALCDPSGAPPAGFAARCCAALDDGSALSVFERMVSLQGGDLEAFLALPGAPAEVVVRAERSGIFLGVDARELGEAIRGLGAGRYRMDDRVDHSAGWEQLVPGGAGVSAGQALGRVMGGGTGSVEEAASRIGRAIVWDGDVQAAAGRVP